VHHAATDLDILDRGYYQHFGRRSQRTPEMISLRKWAKLKVLFLLSVIVWLVGCGSVGSIQRLESGEPLMESANLRGKWVTTDANSQEEEYFQIDSATSDIYLVTSLKPNGKLQVLYEVSLVQVGKYTFLDAAFSETESGEEHRDAQDMRVLPIHFIGRVWVAGDTMRVGFLNFEWLEKMISNEKVKLPFTIHQGHDESLLLLTADSHKLAEFVLQYAEDPDAFSPVLTLHRVGPFEKPPAASNP
jgi:hypothetical protein